MRRLIFVVSGIVLTGFTQSHAARGQQQQGERAPQVAAATRTEVLSFVRGYIDAHNPADASARSVAVSRRANVTTVNDGTITRGSEAIRTTTDPITAK